MSLHKADRAIGLRPLPDGYAFSGVHGDILARMPAGYVR
jgi:hypothetical protein